RRGPKKAICAVAASILTAVYHMLKDGTFYNDLGSIHFDRRRPETQARRLVKRQAELANATHLMVAFRQGLNEAGFIEGQNVVIEYRSAEDQAHRLPALVADLVGQQVALIVGNTPSALAAKAATTTVPIVFVTGGDPVIQGFVASLSRPSGNTTGVS